MENTEKKPYETPEIQVIELEERMLLLSASNGQKKYVPNYTDNLG